MNPLTIRLTAPLKAMSTTKARLYLAGIFGARKLPSRMPTTMAAKQPAHCCQCSCGIPPLAASEVSDSTRKYSCTEMANWAWGQRLATAYPAMAGPETPAVTDMKPETAPAPTASDLL